jgi:pSer/pThr/pTyr-binding forkhead associated (FHA) protein
MTGETNTITAQLHITMGPASEHIRYDGKLITGNSIEINTSKKLIIGRNPQIANLQIYDLVDDSSISRVHCTIFFDNQKQSFVISDENSSNGTYLNEVRLNPYEIVSIKHGDTLELGRVLRSGIIFIFSVGAESLAETPKRVVLHADEKSKDFDKLPSFPHLNALLQEKQDAESAPQGIPKNTLNLFEAIQQAFPEDYEEDTKPELEVKKEVETAKDKAELWKTPNQAPLENYDVYISYSLENVDLMESMSKYLAEQHQLSVWADKRIDIGGNWKNEAEKMIAKSACFLLLMSPSAKASEWVRLELFYAANNRLPIFSALLEGNEQTAMPIKLMGTSYAKMTGDAGDAAVAKERLAAEIKSKLVEIKSKQTNTHKATGDD